MQNPSSKPRLIAHTAHAGVAMDRPLEKPPLWRRRLPWIACAALLLAAFGVLVFKRPSQLEVVSSAQLAAVVAGEFRDEVTLRARVEPMRSVQLDAAEAGRVEEVFAHDGEWVEEG